MRRLLASMLAAAALASVYAQDPAPAADTNAAPTPPPDPAANIIARFSFDQDLQATGGSGPAVPVVFKRASAAWVEGQMIDKDMPRLVPGKFGKGLRLESAYENLLTLAQSAAESAEGFTAAGATLSVAQEAAWEGKTALAIATKGEASEEGVSVELRASKAMYNGNAIVGAWYVASVYLKGQGNVKLYLKAAGSETTGEPAYVELANEWKRFTCVLGFPMPGIAIGPKHESDWEKSLPPGTNIDLKLQFHCVATDSQKLNFLADGFQIERRLLHWPSEGALAAPHSWMMGNVPVAQDGFTIAVTNANFKEWKKAGSVAFWFLPNWEMRDGTYENILNIFPNRLLLQHAGGRLQFTPAGTDFTPSDFQNIWHQFVLTWTEAGERALYMDGLDYPNTKGETMPLGKATALAFGVTNAALAPNGVIDDLILFQIALTPDQAKGLVNWTPAKAEPAKTESAAPVKPAVEAKEKAAEAKPETTAPAAEKPAAEAKAAEAAPGATKENTAESGTTTNDTQGK